MSILEDALAAVTGPRAEAYGHPRDNWARTAQIATDLTGRDFTPEECVLILLAVKLARLRQTPNHRDSLVDLAGYAWVLEQLGPPLVDPRGPSPKPVEVKVYVDE